MVDRFAEEFQCHLNHVPEDRPMARMTRRVIRLIRRRKRLPASRNRWHMTMMGMGKRPILKRWMRPPAFSLKHSRQKSPSAMRLKCQSQTQSPALGQTVTSIPTDRCHMTIVTGPQRTLLGDAKRASVLSLTHSRQKRPTMSSLQQRRRCPCPRGPHLRHPNHSSCPISWWRRRLRRRMVPPPPHWPPAMSPQFRPPPRSLS